MARPRVMCGSARADLDNSWKQTVLRYIDPGIVKKGYCLAERRMPLPKERNS
jgi:hypothetical protein